jgi:hypothetical protein
MHYSARVQLGGGVYRGVQQGDKSIGLQTLILFDDACAEPHQRSTMALAVEDLTANAVRQTILAKREEFVTFERFAEKACARVFRYFSRRA